MLTDEEIIAENRREIMRLRALVREYGGKLDDIIEYAKKTMDDSKPYLYGEEERSNDPYACGRVDGEYNALVTVLRLAGEETDHQIQYKNN